MQIAVIGGGLSGLSAAWFLLRDGHQVTLFDEKPGGAIRSVSVDGYLCETGPETWQMTTSALQFLARETGILPEMISASPANKKRYIVKDNMLQKLPGSFAGFLTGSLVFFPQKIKTILALRRPFTVWENLTLYDFFRQAFGETLAEYIASPMSRGIFGMEAQDLELASAFPGLYKHLSEGKSMGQAIRDGVRDRREFWNSVTGFDLNPRERGLVSFRGGLQRITDALLADSEKRGLQLQKRRVHRIRIGDVAEVTAGSNFRFDQIVAAVPATILSQILDPSHQEAREVLARQKSSPVTVVHHAYPDAKTQGFGFLIPKKEKFPFMGTLFPGNLFPDRAPKGVSLLKTIFAGDGRLLSDDDLTLMAWDSHRRLLKLRSKPVFSLVTRHDPGIPRYETGTSAWRREVRRTLPGSIHPIGWSYSGVGLPDAVEAGARIAAGFRTGIMSP